MHNTGSIDSIANVVCLAADERFANRHSSFLLHGIEWGFVHGASLTWAELHETMSRFGAAEERMSGIISARTTLEIAEMSDLYRQGSSLGPSAATPKGICHEVREAVVPAGAPLVSCNFP